MKNAALALLLASAYVVHAAEQGIEATDTLACGAGNQLEQSECIASAFAAADARLNSLYKSLTASLSSPAPLKSAQTAWTRFRDLTCKYETSGIDKGGSILPFAQNACLTKLTEKRIEDIERYIEQECNGCPARKGSVQK
jgi:uncharacterized protein YecT (DUF1311 family)